MDINKPLYIDYSLKFKEGMIILETEYGHKMETVSEIMWRIKARHYKHWKYIPEIKIINIC